MDKITKKTIKRIKAGHHDDLMNAIEFLMDSYDENKFDAGYKSCLDDMSVRAYRLVEYIKEKGWIFDSGSDDDLVKLIEEYFIDVLKKE